MSKIYPAVDPNGLTEFSVVFTDRSLNHMSQAFQGIMRDISKTLKKVYNAAEVLLIPGGGTMGMEAIARQFGQDKRCLVLRNGWFSYRWTQIFEAGKFTKTHEALLAQALSSEAKAPYAPLSLPKILDEIRRLKPEVFFAAHVETASGILLPDDYIEAIGREVHAHGGLFVLDGIASGALWVDMQKLAVDVLLSAPQKSWSSTPCAALIMLSEEAATRMRKESSTSFSLDMNKWRQIMKAYEDGGHAYHATLPTDSLARLHASMKEMEALGFETLRAKQLELGSKIRRLLSEKSYKSVAAEGFESPTVVVSYCDKEAIQKGAAFLQVGVQIAAGVPLACNEAQGFASFRIGLFGLDKLMNIDQTVERLREALDQVALRS